MGLLEEHKAERRERIVKAAKKLVGERGYDGLTMRDLADAARVSVPTLYNLFGSKDAILVAELQSLATSIAASLPRTGDSFFARGMAAFEAVMRFVEEEPAFFRAIMQMFLTSPETTPMRRLTEDAFIAIMTANLDAAKRAGQLADWARPPIVARHMFAQYMAAFLAWGVGDLDIASFRTAALSGLCHLLAGVARGPFAAEVEARIREIPEWSTKEVPDAVASRD